MWIPKWYWEYASRKQDELERRIKRLELILMKEAENKIASLSDKEAGTGYKDGYSTIEEIVNQSLNTMAIAYKYLCFQVFCIPTEEMTDPDAESLEGELADAKKSAGRKETRKSSPQAETDVQTEQQITQAMIDTIRSEQARTGVTDNQILSMHTVKAKKIEDMTVTEYKSVMNRFQKTPDLKKEADKNE